MEYRYVDTDKMESLEDYAMSIVMGMITIKTVMAQHAKAQSIGILTEDQIVRGNTIMWDLTRILKASIEQADSVLELIPGDISIEHLIEKLTAQEKTRARGLLRKK